MYKQHLCQIWTLCQHSADAELFFLPKLLRSTLNNKHFLNHSPSSFSHVYAIFSRQLPQESRHTELYQGKARYHYRTALYPETKALFNDQTGELLLTTWSTNRAGRAIRIMTIHQCYILYPFNNQYGHFHHWHYFNVLLLDICIDWLSN